MAVAPKANAQIVYTDVDPDEVLAGTSFDIDFDGDGIVDAQLSQSGISTSGFVIGVAYLNIPAGNAAIGSNGSATATNTAYPSVLASGAAIAPGDSHFNEQTAQVLGAGINGLPYFGQWDNQAGYVGIRFDIGGETHYGWVELAVSAGSQSVTVKSYAYETIPDMAINAGDPGISTGLAQLAMPLQLGVFPNPARDMATVDFSGLKAGTAELSIINGIGRVVQSQQVEVADGSNRLDLHLGSLPAGSYFVRLRNADQVAFQKVSRVD